MGAGGPAPSRASAPAQTRSRRSLISVRVADARRPDGILVLLPVEPVRRDRDLHAGPHEGRALALEPGQADLQRGRRVQDRAAAVVVERAEVAILLGVAEVQLESGG